MRRTLLTAALVTAAAGTCAAQTVELRVVEESATAAGVVVSVPPAQGTTLAAANPIGNYAVQARVTAGPSGVALADVTFVIQISGEADSSGTLAKMHTSVSGADHAYYSGAPGVSAAVGIGGLPWQYTYLASINSQLNGLINTSGGTFTNDPSQQEIGLIAGATANATLLSTPGVDPNGEGNPATWTGYGSGGTPSAGDTAALDPTVGASYFAQGQFIDVYRFRYTLSNFAGRSLTITLGSVSAQVFGRLVFNAGAWGPNTQGASTSVSVAGLQVAVLASGPCCGPDGSCQVTMQSGCPSGSTWMGTGSCSPNECPQLGTCCNSANACSFMFAGACSGAWAHGGACVPNPCPLSGVCCLGSGACVVALQAQCNAPWHGGGSCVPLPCGTCCTGQGACSFVVASMCVGAWTNGGTCYPSSCPLPGACCHGMACTMGSAAACTGAYLGDASVCDPRVRIGRINACCPVDFNNSGSLNSGDIFDFLNDWFVGCP